MPTVLVTTHSFDDDARMTTGAAPWLANRLRVARAERRISQDELARAVGVSRNTVGSIENLRYTPSALLAFRLAKVLEMPVTQLFWIEGDDR